MQAQETRRKVIATAARLFRRHGFGGVSIPRLMREIGLTHGGFYANFDSKPHLEAIATSEAFDLSVARWGDAGALTGDQAMAAFVDAYLSDAHRNDPDNGCVLSTLAQDAARGSNGVRRAFAQGVERYVAYLEQLAPRGDGTLSREAALAMLSQLAGAMMLARAVDDDELAAQFLASAKAAIVQPE